MRRRGLTLLEVMLAIGLIVLVSSMMFMFYHQSLQIRKHVQKAVSTGYLARTIAHQIAEEIRAANGFLIDAGPGISGTDRLITLQTVRMPDKKLFRKLSIKDDPPPAESDIRQVQYYLAYDDEETYTYPDGTEADKPLGLVRREIKTLHQTALFENRSKSVDLDLISPELKYVRFRYFDGVEWLDKWDIGNEPEGGLGNSLPQAVEITVGYDELPPPEEEEDEEDEEALTDSELAPSLPEPYSPDSYTVTVRLPQADVFFGSRIMRAQRRSRAQRSER
ncbi:MAG: hypothetical protein ACE5EC_01725 [Phycisphaerae bacterium]